MLFAELIIIGLEGGIWLLLLALTVFGWQGAVNVLAVLYDWQVMLIAVFTPLLYVLGIILDRLCDRLLQGWGRQIRRKAISDLPVHPTLMRFALDPKNESVNQQIEYTRSRMRIARASTINVALITLFAATFVLTQPLGLAPDRLALVLGFVLVIGAALTAGSVYAWRSLIISQLHIVRSNYELQHAKEEASGADALPGAAR